MKQQKRQDYFVKHSIKHIDYKDTELLKKFLDTHGRIQNHHRTGTKSSHQRKLAQAVKRARFMGLLPYIVR